MTTTRRPSIGVFDSGFGGLTVLKQLITLAPEADYLYFGDTARLPYGSKSADTVARYAIGAAQFLEQHGAQMLVIACNTATALALDQITQASSVPVVGVIEPGASQAAAATKMRNVVVIGTEGTVSSHAYAKALRAHGVHATEKACPLFVPLVEEGWTQHPGIEPAGAEQAVTEQVARIYLDKAFGGDFKSADVLVLGCTHYPLLKPLLRRLVPEHVTIVDSADSTAHVVSQLLRQGLPNTSSDDKERRGTPRIRFFVTDSVEKFRRLGVQFLGKSIEDVEHVALKE
jgi:glutamate racemase